RLAGHPAVVEGRIDTGYLDRHLDEFMPAQEAEPALLLAAAVVALLAQEADARERAAASADPGSPWAIADGWHLGHAGFRPLALPHRGDTVHLRARGAGGDYRIDRDGQVHKVQGARL